MLNMYWLAPHLCAQPLRIACFMFCNASSGLKNLIFCARCDHSKHAVKQSGRAIALHTNYYTEECLLNQYISIFV